LSESFGLAAMFLRQFLFVGSDDVAVADDLFSSDVQAIDSMRPGEDETGDGIVGASELQSVGAPDRDVGAFPR
jgi:hypothetical protein